VVAEVLMATIDPRFGGMLYAFLLVVLLQHGARCSLQSEHRLYWTLSLIPIMRLLSVSMPLGAFPVIWRFILVAVPLLLAIATAARAARFSPEDIGLRWRWGHAHLNAMLAIAGVPLGMAYYQILKPAPLAAELSLQAILAPAVVLIVTTGFSEEIIFRGLLQRAAGELLGPWIGPALITCLWAVLHISYRSWDAFYITLLAGALFAIVAGHTRSIWGVTLAHGLANVTLLLLAPFLMDQGVLPV